MKKQTIKLISWNVNGIRAVLKKGFVDFVNAEDPDVLCLQETKAERGQALIDLPEYQEYWYSATKKGYSGTAIFTKTKPLSVVNGIPKTISEKFNLVDAQGRNANDEGRVIAAEFDTFFVVVVYTPNSKDNLERLSLREKQWDTAFLAYMKHLEKKKPVIFCGDLNVAHQEIDLARPEDNEGKHGFTKEERSGFDNILAAGFIDTYRNQYPTTTGAYTWWTHWANARARNVGWRIDYVMVSSELKKHVVDAFILPAVTGSDHCPVGIHIKI